MVKFKQPEERAEENYRAFVRCKGEYADGVEQDWADNAAIRRRLVSVLCKYRQYKKVVVACHGTIIQSLRNVRHPDHGEIVPFNLDEEE